MSYLETPTRYITVNNQKIAYRELGEGNSDIPLVMLVHLAATMDDWDPKLVDLLAEHQHIIVMDLPGVGSSEGSVATTIPVWLTRQQKLFRPSATRRSTCWACPWAA